MRFLIVRTDIRAANDDELAAAWVQGECLRDERNRPEPRRQVVRADDREAALHLARALASVGAVRSGRQRVKVLPVGEPEHRRRDDRRGGGTDAGGPTTPANGSNARPTVLDPSTGGPLAMPGGEAPPSPDLGPRPGILGTGWGMPA